MDKILVAYFSVSGITKSLAKKLASKLDADLFEIKPKVAYTHDDLDWRNKNSRSTLETNDPNSRPEIEKDVLDMSGYDIIFLGFPIWWYVAPRIIETFLESYDFTGKKIVTFATSGGSGMGKTTELLKKICPKANLIDGKILNGMSDSELKDWASEFLD